MVGNAGMIRGRAELRIEGLGGFVLFFGGVCAKKLLPEWRESEAASPCFIKILYGRHLFSILFNQFFFCTRKCKLCEF